MRRVFGLGETVFDIIFKDGQPLSAKAGGSVLNALVSLARLGHQTYFISELGNDKVGDTIINFLNQNNINTSYLKRYNHGQSALAMAFLNEQNDAEYDFYKNYPNDRLEIELPDFKTDDILLFGSFYAIDSNIRKQAFKIVDHAKQWGCIIIYDPNFRNKHASNLTEYNSYIEENISAADIIRGSNEDFYNIFSTTSADESFLNIKDKCSQLVYTENTKGVTLRTNNISKHYPVPKIKPVSTIGAGDNFNAGIIHKLIESNILKKNIHLISELKWDKIIESGIKLSTDVCMSLDNYISK
ncbi:carbohydrate kinase [Labilibacter sediminis]|nr:carbohydrate kinase [Labilibacter sediminis]